MSAKEQLARIIQEHGLRLTLETIAAICSKQRRQCKDDETERRDWNKAKLRLLKMSQDMIL
jgi:hypothetical protein